MNAHTCTPITCTPWCADGDGHPHDVYPQSQQCMGAAHYLNLPLNPRQRGTDGIEDDSIIGVFPQRDNGRLAHVHLHLMLVSPEVDLGVKLSPAEARWLAAELVRVAAVAEDTPATG